jgi:hypothetical protein
VPAENPAVIKNYCKFTVAQFNRSTVQAFQKDLRSPAGLENPNEFLIQALYGSFGANLGLPGFGTDITSGGLIAPKEVSFVGLYRLLERFPDFTINYRSSEYTEVLSQNLKKAITDERTDISQVSRIIQPRHKIEFESEYLEIWSIIREKQKEIKTSEVQFKNDFFLLLAMVKLLSAIDNKTLFEQLDHDLNLLSPEQQDSWANRYIGQDCLAQVPGEKVEHFIKILQSVPSEKMRLLEELQVRTLELRTYLMEV